MASSNTQTLHSSSTWHRFVWLQAVEEERAKLARTEARAADAATAAQRAQAEGADGAASARRAAELLEAAARQRRLIEGPEAVDTPTITEVWAPVGQKAMLNRHAGSTTAVNSCGLQKNRGCLCHLALMDSRRQLLTLISSPDVHERLLVCITRSTGRRWQMH